MRACSLLHDLLADTAAAIPDAVAVVDAGRPHTYGDLARRIHALAHALGELGVRRGDRVVVFSNHGIEAVIACWAVLEASAVLVVAHPDTELEAMCALLADTRARALISHRQLEAVYAPAARRAPHLSAVIVAGGRHGAPRGANADPPALVGWDHVATSDDRPPPRRCIDLDLAAIVHEPGEPHGVMRTHRGLLATVASLSSCLALRSGDVVLGALPLASDQGLLSMLLSVAAGARLILEPSCALSVDVMRRAAEERVTVIPGTPAMLAPLLGLDARWDLSAVRLVTTTVVASELPALRRLFPQAELVSLVGLAGCGTCTVLAGPEVERKPGSAGLALPNTELWITDAEGHPVGAAEVGEIVIRGATVPAGFWGDADETARRLRPWTAAGDRALHTGALGRLDDEGYLYVVAADAARPAAEDEVASRQLGRSALPDGASQSIDAA